MNKIITIAACLTATTLLHAQTTIYVTPNGTGNGISWATACNLENAVTNAISGDQIWVQKGTYYPSKMLVVSDSVKIYGGFAGTETALSQRNYVANITIVDGQQKIGSIFRLENSAEINGFTIQNGNANGNLQKSGGGVWVDENCVIENCKIINNTAMLNGGGVYANGKVKIINSTINDNIAHGNGINTYGNCLMIVSEQIGAGTEISASGCNPNIPYLGEISFKTQTVWQISGNDVHQEWSDVVMASGCNKTCYNGGTTGNYIADCRANTNRTTYGDLFSWCAVTRFANVLCPAPWRVPTIEDFCALDKALGGQQCAATWTSYTDAAMHSKYLTNSGATGQFWGGTYGGNCDETGVMYYQGGSSEYSTFTESDASTMFIFAVNNAYIVHLRHNFYTKGHGFMLRCIR